VCKSVYLIKEGSLNTHSNHSNRKHPDSLPLAIYFGWLMRCIKKFISIRTGHIGSKLEVRKKPAYGKFLFDLKKRGLDFPQFDTTFVKDFHLHAAPVSTLRKLQHHDRLGRTKPGCQPLTRQ
jgi:hypothetical protein